MAWYGVSPAIWRGMALSGVVSPNVVAAVLAWSRLISVSIRRGVMLQLSAMVAEKFPRPFLP